MAETYVRLYGMTKVKAWVGEPKPDAPSRGPAVEEDSIYREDSDLEEGFTDEKGNYFFRDEETPALGGDNTKEGFIGYGLSVQKALYRDAGLRKVLRLLTIGEISRTFPNTQFISANNYRDAESLGAFRKASITLKAVNEANVYPLFGKEHSTTVRISSSAILSEISTFLARTAIKIGSDNIPYKIVANSVKLIASRSSNTPIC